MSTPLPSPHKTILNVLKKRNVENADDIAEEIFSSLGFELRHETYFDDPHDSFSTDVRYRYQTGWSSSK